MFSKLFEPKKTAIMEPPPVDEEFRDQYNETAKRIGIKARIHTEARLTEILHELSLTAYDRAKVERYMDKKGYWHWYPLRVSDKNPGALQMRVTQSSYPRIYGSVEDYMYVEAIPYPVLQTISQVLEKSPEVNFFVAALDKNPDPFLAVVLGGEAYIIERWDEPSFRG